MYKVFRYRVKGSSSLRKLARMAKAVNFIWNFCNDTQKFALRHCKRWPSIYDFQPLVAETSKELGLHSQTVQAVCRQYVQSRTISKKRKLRYRGARALGWVPFDGQAIRHRSDAFKFMGHLFRVWLSRDIPGRIRCGSFAQDSRGHWYINLCVDVPIVVSCGQGQVGIDLGLKTTATLSDRSKYDGVRAFRTLEPKIATAQRARKKQQLRALHARAKNRRRDGLHKLSTQLVRDHNLVAVGNVNCTKLAKTKMAKSVYDAGWGLLRDMLRYKTIAGGATYKEVDEAYSSQRCSHCGTLPDSRPKGIAALQIREWTWCDLSYKIRHTAVFVAQGLTITIGVLHQTETPPIWVPQLGGAKEKSDVLSAEFKGDPAGSLKLAEALAETERLSLRKRPIKSVTSQQAQEAGGLDQNGTWVGSLNQTVNDDGTNSHRTRGRSQPGRSSKLGNRVSPMRSMVHMETLPQGRVVAQGVKESRRKQTLFSNWTDRARASEANLTRKSAHFRRVSVKDDDLETLTTRRR